MLWHILLLWAPDKMLIPCDNNCFIYLLKHLTVTYNILIILSGFLLHLAVFIADCKNFSQGGFTCNLFLTHLIMWKQTLRINYHHSEGQICSTYYTIMSSYLEAINDITNQTSILLFDNIISMNKWGPSGKAL